MSDRQALSAAAFCIHCVKTSPNARKHGISPAQRGMIESCAKVLSDTDRHALAKMGHAEFLRVEPA